MWAMWIKKLVARVTLIEMTGYGLPMTRKASFGRNSTEAGHE
jgi:hypothetical protein